jgi:NADP-dependent 3-hydroxy acid dehydrogenase YdfG
MTNLPESTIIVTGGSRGYGAGIAEAFVKAGARVWITGRDAAKLNEAAQRIGAAPFVADVADGQAWDRLINEALA